MKRLVSSHIKKIAAATAVMSLALSFFAGYQAHAQNISGTTDSLEFTQSPVNPYPGQTVTVTLQAYTINIDASDVTWSAGGKILGKGIGLTTITVQAPAEGKILNVNAAVSSPDGTILNGSSAITSGSVDMIVESQGYIPPIFQGKVPAAYQDTMTVTAIPHLANSSGAEYDPKTLLYKWDQDGSVLADQSGYGKQSVSIFGNIVPRPSTITVTVTTRDGLMSSIGVAGIGYQAPSAAFYNNDPLYGPLFNRAIGNNFLLGTQKEVGMLAVPYGFATDDSHADLSFSWLINGTVQPGLTSNSSITLRSPDGQSGSSDIQLTVTNTKDILQQAQSGFTAIWSTPASNSTSATF